MNSVVLDANIFLKLFKEENDSGEAKKLIQHLAQSLTPILAPCVVINETLHACEREKIDISVACRLFIELQRSNLTLMLMTEGLIERAYQITKIGHEKSGFPTFSDSVYHAIALQENAVFITADHRHFVKTERLGHILMLDQWAS